MNRQRAQSDASHNRPRTDPRVPTLNIHFDNRDMSMGVHNETHVLNEASRIYGVQARRNSFSPDVTIHTGSPANLRDHIRNNPGFGGSAFLRNVVAQMVFEGARGVTGVAGRRDIAVRGNVSSAADYNINQRVRTAVHELGHSVGLEHASAPANTNNIMHSGDNQYQHLTTSQEQRSTVRRTLYQRGRLRAHSI